MLEGEVVEMRHGALARSWELREDRKALGQGRAWERGGIYPEILEALGEMDPKVLRTSLGLSVAGSRPYLLPGSHGNACTTHTARSSLPCGLGSATWGVGGADSHPKGLSQA